MAESEITYEVQVQQLGRWEIYGKYRESNRELALEQAEGLIGNSGFDAIRVVKDILDVELGTSDEHVIYSAGNAIPSKPVGQARTGGAPVGGGGGMGQAYMARGAPVARDAAAGTPQEVPRRLTKAAQYGALGQLTFIVGVAFAVGAIVTGIIAAGINFLPASAAMSSTLQVKVLSAAFTGTFLIAAVSIAVMFATYTSRQGPELQEAAPPPPAPAPPPEPAEDAETDDAGLAGSPGESGETEGEDSGEAATEAEVEAESEPEPEPEPEEDEEDHHVLSPFAEEQKVFLMSFLGAALKNARGADKKLDAFNKFGVSLFLAGAAEALGGEKDLDGETVVALLKVGVLDLGIELEQAKTLSRNYEKYLLADRRYMQMFHAGRNAMSLEMKDTEDGAAHLVKALEDWNEPKKEEEAAGTVAVLFTDIVGSTDMTQEKGDATAQKIVHAHNDIVRNALKKCGGKEVKHTGDGIMAAFTVISQSVDAAILMQKDVAQHNKSRSDLRLHLKLGIHAGETIVEDKDHFGTTVQLSARVVDECGTDQIYVSETVHGICAGKDLVFENLGETDLKGFKEPVTLFEVLWKKDKTSARKSARKGKPARNKKS